MPDRSYLAVPLVGYSYRVIDGKLDEIQGHDNMDRKQFYMNRMHVMEKDALPTIL